MRSGQRVTQQPQQQQQTTPLPYEYLDVHGVHSGRTHQIRVPQCDIDASIKFSWFRCLFVLSGLLLVLSDIPRSGYGVSGLATNFRQVAPDTVMYFGPYAYCTAQIQRATNGSTFTGTCGASAIAAATVWAYKYDSLSIALRAIVQQLDVRAYPQCLLYVNECASSHLNLSVAFEMLDALVHALVERHFASATLRNGAREPFVLESTSYWIDRLHHIVLDKLGWHRIDKRLHVAHYYTRSSSNRNDSARGSSLSLCRPEQPRMYRPVFCTAVIAWGIGVEHSAIHPAADAIVIGVDEHIDQRLASLEQQFPDLEFDLTVVTTHQASSNHRRMRYIPSAYFKSESNEITTLIRGRLCTDSQSSPAAADRTQHCETQLVDDFRYERAILRSNVEDWYVLARLMRAAAQLYVWLRVASLWVGCYFARCGEPKFIVAAMSQRLRWTTTTVFKIPSHVVVYGSWIPIVLYALAHLLDSGVVHLLCERVWTSAGGSVRFDLFAYVYAASVQMRNAWFIALAVKVFAMLQVQGVPARRAPWMLRHGLVGVRGGLIGLLSSITIFSYLRFYTFRHTAIIDVRRLSVATLRAEQQSLLQFETASEFGFYFDLRVILTGLLAMLCATVALKLYLSSPRWLYSRRQHHQDRYAHAHDVTTSVLFSTQHGLPYSLGTLVPLTALSAFWSMTMSQPTASRHAHESQQTAPTKVAKNKVAALEAVTVAAKSLQRLPSLRQRSQSSHPVRARHQPSILLLPDAVDVATFFQPEKRSSASWARVQLVNIALLTEPLALFRLFVVGRELYVYRCVTRPQRHDSSSTQLSYNSLFLLPCDAQTLAQNTESSKGASPHYELVDIVSSKSVAWRLLTLCG